MTNELKPVDYRDENGVMRRVLLPADSDRYDPEEGVPLDLYGDLDELYQDAPPVFRYNLYQMLYDRGLIEPADFLAPGALDIYRQVILSIIKHDGLSAQALAKERMKNGSR
jgi:hypothetical protein